MAGSIIGVLVVAAVITLGCFPVVVDASAVQHVVGGQSQWTFGFNYTNWALTAAPFYTGDTLVFKYEPRPYLNQTIIHNVYLFQDLAHFQACNFANASMLAGPLQGNPGFEYKLTERAWYHFGCGIHEGIHCSQGLMKFRIKAMHHGHMG